MKRTLRRLRSNLGETFVEVLIALMIVALASMLLVSMVSASGSIDSSVRGQDKEFYAAVTALEAGKVDTSAGGSETPDKSVTVTWTKKGNKIFDDITIYEQDGLKAYKGG